MKGILVIRPGAIGDALLTFPVLKALREQYDGMRITLVSNTQVLPLAQAFGVAEQAFDFQDIQWSELFSSSGIRTSAMRDLLEQTELAICWMRDPDGIIEHNLKMSGIEHSIIAPGRPSTGERLHIVDYLARTIGLPNVGAQFIAPSSWGFLNLSSNDTTTNRCALRRHSSGKWSSRKMLANFPLCRSHQAIMGAEPPCSFARRTSRYGARE